MINNIVLLTIRCYWLLVPEKKRRKCLFKTSCSHFVFQQTKNKGLRAGFRAFLFRIKNCNANYQIMDVGDGKILITKTNKVIPENELSEFILGNITKK